MAQNTILRKEKSREIFIPSGSTKKEQEMPGKYVQDVRLDNFMTCTEKKVLENLFVEI